MRDRPTALDLLETARAALMDELLPALPADRRYTAHLIGAAMAMAAREAEAGGAAEDDERRALADLLAAEGSLEALNRALAAAIRQGRYDTEREAAYRLLAQATRAKVLENNPGYLEGPHHG